MPESEKFTQRDDETKYNADVMWQTWESPGGGHEALLHARRVDDVAPLEDARVEQRDCACYDGAGDAVGSVGMQLDWLVWYGSRVCYACAVGSSSLAFAPRRRTRTCRLHLGCIARS